MVTTKAPKNAKTFSCEPCDFKCSKHSDYKRHLLTAKHKLITDDNYIEHENAETRQRIYRCNCGKEYKFSSGLSRHTKKCKYIAEEIENTFIPDNVPDTATTIPTSAELLAIIKQLVIQNATTSKQFDELQATMKEIIPKIGNTTTTTNSNNNTFNVQMFLDNQCKDAMSIQDFVNSIELNMSHMLAITKDGYVDSISNVLIDSLNKLKLTDRPLHCTDLKRETIYIKDQEAWNKSTADAPLMNRVITNIEDKHYALVGEYVRKHPQTNDVDSPECTLYTKACINSLGNGEDHTKLNKKICKKILPAVKLEKETV
jgi:hypothetical protein